MNCPQCSSVDIRSSRRSHWMDSIQRLLGRQAFRCRKCRHRFFALPTSLPAENRPGHPPRKHQHTPLSAVRKKRRLFRRMIAFAVVVVMVSLFWAFLSYVSVDHTHQVDDDGTGSSQ